MNTRSRRWCLIATWLAAASLAQADPEWLLRLDLKKDDRHRFAFSSSQSMKMDMGQMTQDVENTSRIELSQTVTEKLPDGSFVLDMAYERMQSEMKVGEMKLGFDTADPEPSQHPMARLQRSLTGKRFSVTMTPRGEVRSVVGMDEIFDGMAETTADDRTIEATLEVFKEGFGNEAMKSMMQQGAVMFPEQAVGVGDTWQDDVTIQNPALGEVRIRSDYRVERPDSTHGRDCLEIAVTMDIAFGDGGQMFPQMARLFGTEVDIDVQQASGEGVICMDTATGLVVDSEMRQVMEMDVSVEVPEQDAAAGQKMEMHALIHQRFGVELLN